MSSLVFFASPVDNNDNIVYKNQTSSSGEYNGNVDKTQSNNTTNNKRKNKTQKNTNIYTDKVNRVLSTIHGNNLYLDNEEDDDNNFHNFMPIEPPQSSGVQKTISNEQSKEQQPKKHFYNSNINANNNDSNNTNNEDRQTTTKQQGYSYPKFVSPILEENTDDRQDQHILFPQHSQQPSLYQQHQDYLHNWSQSSGQTNPNDILLNKLNYMIHLLEEQQDEKTGNVLEEVVLYSFLGIFIIFIIDSFVRVGKYTR